MDFGLSEEFAIFADEMSEPLAERMRPRTLDEYIGQKHIVGEGAVLRKMIDAGRISSFILWTSKKSGFNANILFKSVKLSLIRFSLHI